MDKLRAMETFVRIVEAGSLTAAAGVLGLSVPAVVRSLAALEGELGVRLLNRTTRRSSLTDEGREYHEHCRRVLADIDGIESMLSSRRVEPRGRLRITAPVMCGRLHVAPLLIAFLRRYPQVEAELLLHDRVVDLVDEGIDAAFRIAQLPESSLVAVRIGSVRQVVCAAPSWLARHGEPQLPADLARNGSILFTGLGAEPEWRFGVRPQTRVALRPVLRTNQVDVAVAACVEGLGCARLLDYQINEYLRDGRLRRILQAFEPPAVPVQIVRPQARLLSANLRAFLDFAREAAGLHPPGADRRA